MERPAHLLIQRPPQFSPRMIAAISGAVVLDAALIYFVATGLTINAIRALPHTIQVEVLKTPMPPKVQPIVVPPTQLARPTVATVPQPVIQIQTPQPQPQITVAKMSPHPVVQPPVPTAPGPPAPPAPAVAAAPPPPPPPPAPPKPQPITEPVSIGGSHSCMNDYPAVAQRLNQQGTTTVGFTVDTDGSVSNVHVVSSSGHDMLDDAAVRCASSWRYKPAHQNGEPVQAPWTTNVQWTLQNGSSPM